jgi:hypothetical protein
MSMKRRGVVLLSLLAVWVLWSVGGVREASASGTTTTSTTSTIPPGRVWKVVPPGISVFLTGYWVGNDPNTGVNDKTKITLQNPTANTQIALIIYYDDNENFLDCDIQVLTKHDIETFTPHNVGFSGTSMFAPKKGAFEVLSDAAGFAFNDPKNLCSIALGPPTFTVPIFPGYPPSVGYDFLVENFTTGLAGDVRRGGTSSIALHQVDFLYFTPPGTVKTGEPSQAAKTPDGDVEKADDCVVNALADHGLPTNTFCFAGLGTAVACE